MDVICEWFPQDCGGGGYQRLRADPAAARLRAPGGILRNGVRLKPEGRVNFASTLNVPFIDKQRSIITTISHYQHHDVSLI